MTDGIVSGLFELKDDGYKEFHKKLIPNIDENLILGVRTPVLRKYATTVYKQMDYESFLKDLPHTYYEENNLHSFIISMMKDYDTCIEYTCAFLPYIDNWATCDSFSPKVFAKNKDKLFVHIKQWIQSDDTYTIRCGVNMLMKHYLDEDFKIDYADMVAAIKSDEYYVKMVIAWYFATALAKQYDLVIPYIEAKKLEKWTHNKAIQKSIESYRILDEQKAYLRSLKI